MKKLFLIILFSMTMVACGGGDGGSNSPGTPSTGSGNENELWGAKWNTELTWK